MPAEHITSRADSVVDFRLERLRRTLRKGNTAATQSLTQQYAEGGLAEAQYLLAEMLVSTGRPEETEAAKRWYEAAALQGHVSACKKLWQATSGSSEDALATSLEFMIRAADLGDYQASGLLILRYGQSPDAQVPNMLAYLQRHVARGHAYAQTTLADAYDFARFGLAPDAERAFDLYMLAAQQGDVHAQCWVGVCYAHGLGVEQNDEQAVHWYRKAARRGSAQAQYNLGYSYAIGRKPCLQSMSEANRWYRRAALRDFPQAQHNLGLSYRLGSSLPQHHGLANRWIARAAQQGLPEAQCSLGLSYERGLGVDPNPLKAAELYAAAARSGHAQAQQNYGFLLETGLGVAKNSIEAVRWYRAAAEQGLASAQSCLATMYATGTGITKSLQDALRYYSLAASQNDERGIKGVAWITHELATVEAGAELSALDGKLLRTDPDYKTKRQILVAVLKPVFARLDPSEWATTFEKAYENLSSAPASNASGQTTAAERDPTDAPRGSKPNMSGQ